MNTESIIRITPPDDVIELVVRALRTQLASLEIENRCLKEREQYLRNHFEQQIKLRDTQIDNLKLQIKEIAPPQKQVDKESKTV